MANFVYGTFMNSFAQRSNNRNDIILDVAAEQFSNNGFHETSIRDIAKAVGMLPGSIYYHYSSKDDLLLAVYEKGVSDIVEKFLDSVSSSTDPWEKLSAAIGAHIGAITRNNPYMKVINRVLPEQVGKHKAALCNLRETYEKYFRDLIEQLPLDKSIDKNLLRLIILGSANHSQFWFNDKKGLTPEEIGKRFSDIIIGSICKKNENSFKRESIEIKGSLL